MSTTDTPTSSTGLPVGTWVIDPTHSVATFAVKHMAVATFRGSFESFDATLTVTPDSAELVGTVDVASLKVKDEALQGHLGSPEFFDLERYPQIVFRAKSLKRSGDELIVDGEMTIKDKTRPVAARGTVAGPLVTLYDMTKIGITLEAIVDRTEFDLAWNAPLPQGGFVLSNEVKLTVELELVQS